MKEMQKREKEWRDEIQAKFDQSLASIRVEIAKQEADFGEAANENDLYRQRINELIEHEKQRSQDFEKLYVYVFIKNLESVFFFFFNNTNNNNNNNNNINNINNDNNNRKFAKELEKNKEQMHDLTTKLAKTIQMNVMMQQRCTDNEYIGQFQEMKKTMLKQNKEFGQNKKDLQLKYTQLNAFNEATKLSADNIYRKNETLEILCKNLQQQNDALKDCQT
ncbi:hypothetical protein RFI_26499 [Reticulomyxa filosa]|uniref:Viral A-type inclusion protein n=1 Tax=Reticulomyxa filosa TaxID=46433 RepID=X6MA71_RETFI|nr:hypothetical protein RFI_26499 [Reticulomyxa filosa]|eukprot:ETO10878.1 hypothetical protein RFI_26499 [Reticulomyxa filosa]